MRGKKIPRWTTYVEQFTSFSFQSVVSCGRAYVTVDWQPLGCSAINFIHIEVAGAAPFYWRRRYRTLCQAGLLKFVKMRRPTVGDMRPTEQRRGRWHKPAQRFEAEGSVGAVVTAPLDRCSVEVSVRGTVKKGC